MYDLLIKNGRILDGTGAPWYRGDLAIIGDEIVGIGKFSDEQSLASVDAQDFYVSPGFIDIHSHSDDTLADNPLAESRIHQGITTEIAGNCGLSVVPSASVDAKYSRMGEYLGAMSRIDTSVNFAMLVGQGAIRASVMGYSSKQATEQQMDAMRAYAEEALQEGAFGISTGLIYPPGCFSSTEEIAEIVKTASRYGAYYSTHIRGEGPTVVEGIKEALEIAEMAEVPLHVSHHKVIYSPDWRVSCKTTIALMEEARRRGRDVTADQYPYNASATNLSANLPSWAFDGGDEALFERLRDPITRGKIIKACEEAHSNHWDEIHVSYLNTKENSWMVGKSVADIAKALGKASGSEALMDILLAEKNHVGEIHFNMCEEDIEYIMTRDFVMTGSDGSAISMNNPGMPHPRNYGAFVRTLTQIGRAHV